ncbi:MAG: recombinase [bacterium]|nr:recombinase [bacterium]
MKPTQKAIKALKKRKKPKISTLDKKLWRLFSKFIRLRDRFQGDYCKCISCGSIKHWKDMHAGHFIGRRHLGTKYDPKNVHAQCCSCNTFGEGEQFKYGQNLIKKYGEGIINELEVKKKLNPKKDWTWYDGMIEVYTKKVRKLEE